MAGADGHEGFENGRKRMGEWRAPRRSLLRRRQADQEGFREKACDGPIVPISIHSLMHCSSEVANHATRSNMESCA